MSQDPDTQRKVKALQIAALERAKARAQGATENQANDVWQASLAVSGEGMDPVAGLFWVGLLVLLCASIAVDSWWPFAVVPACFLIPLVPKVWAALEGRSFSVYVGGGLLAAVALSVVLGPFIGSRLPNPRQAPEKADNQAAPGYRPQYAKPAPAAVASTTPPPVADTVVPTAEPTPAPASAPVLPTPPVATEVVATALPDVREPQEAGPWAEPRFKVVRDLLTAAGEPDSGDRRWWNSVEAGLVAYAPNGRSPRMGDRIESKKAVALAMEAAKKKELAGAVPFFRQAVEIDPSNTDAILGLATALHILKRTDEGATVLLDALLSDPTNEYLWYHLSELTAAVPERTHGAMSMAVYLAQNRQEMREMLRRDFGSWPAVTGTLMVLDRLPSRGEKRSP